MPYRDGTGPWGYGPRTGRGFGPCGRGPGMIGPRRFMTYAPTREQEIADLKSEKEAVEQGLKDIEARLRELEKK